MRSIASTACIATALAALMLGGCSTNTGADSPTRTQPQANDANAPARDAQPAAQKQTQTDKNEPATAREDSVRVGLETSKGTIIVELDRKRAPITTANFLDYVDSDFYDGTIFHRIVPGFVIQGGGHTPDMTEKETNPPIENEWRNELKNVRGTIAMAREQDPDTATSQFYINLTDNAALDQPRPQTGHAAYAVFGKVVEGMDVVDAIASVETTRVGQFQGVPAEPILIERAYRVDESD